MDPSQPKSVSHDLQSKQLHNEKLLITSFFAAIQGNPDHGHEMLQNFGPHLASIMTHPINMERIIPDPPPLLFNQGGSSDQSSVPSQLTKTSETSNSNLFHSNVSGIVSDVASVCTNSSDESVPRSAIVIPPLRGKEGGDTHTINLVTEGDEFELDRDCSMERSSVEGSQGEYKRQRVVDSTSYFENDLNAIKKYLDSESKEFDPESSLPPEYGE